MSLSITKHDGTKESFNADRINRSIERAARGLSNPVAMATQIATETRLTLYDGITTEEMDQATINAAVQNIKEDIEYDKAATRLLLKAVYRRVLEDYENNPGLLARKHREFFAEWIKRGVDEGILDPRMMKKFNLKDLASVLDITR